MRVKDNKKLLSIDQPCPKTHFTSFTSRAEKSHMTFRFAQVLLPALTILSQSVAFAGQGTFFISHQRVSHFFRYLLSPVMSDQK